MNFLSLFCFEILGIQSNWTRNDRDAPMILTENCFCRISSVVSSSLHHWKDQIMTWPSPWPEISIIAVSRPEFSPTKLLTQSGSMLPSLVPRTHVALFSMSHMISSKRVPLGLREIMQAGGTRAVFGRCAQRSPKEATAAYTASAPDRPAPILSRPGPTDAWPFFSSLFCVFRVSCFWFLVSGLWFVVSGF